MREIQSAIVTGPTGAIGIALLQALAARGVEVYAVCRPGSRRIANLPKDPHIHVVECDISDYASLAAKGYRADALFHFAWEKTTVAGRDDMDCQLKNIAYTLDAVRLAKAAGCSVFIGAGSQAEYGVQQVPLAEDTPVRPESGYGIAKYTAGRMAKTLCAKEGIAFCWVRILSVFGPGDGENSLISYLISALQKGETPKLTPCEQTWDYLYAADAGRAFADVAERGVDGRTYCLGGGKPHALRTYVETLRDVVAPEVAIAFGAKEYYPHQAMYLVADITALTADTAWEPRVSFADGIREMISKQREQQP